MPTRRERRVARRRRRNVIIALLACIAVAAAAAVALGVSNNDPAPETTRRTEATNLLASLNRTEPLTVGFAGSMSVTIDGTTTTTTMDGDGHFVGPDDADLEGLVRPAEGDPIEVALLRSDGRRFLSIDGAAYEGGDGSLLPGVTGSMLDGLRTLIELDELATELEMRGGDTEKLIQATVDDVNAGLVDPPRLDTTVELTFDGEGTLLKASATAVGGSEGDELIQIDLFMDFSPATDVAPRTIPPTAVDGPGSALQYPVVAEALRETYGYPPPIVVTPTPSTSLPPGQTVPGAPTSSTTIG